MSTSRSSSSIPHPLNYLQNLSNKKWQADFFLPHGFVAAANSDSVAMEWYNHSRFIYLNGDVLSNILEEMRAVNLGKMLVEFIAVEDETLRENRQNAWNFLVKKLLPESGSQSDGEICKMVLHKLAEDKYQDHYSLDQYLTGSDEAIASSLKVMNVSLKPLFDFLTPRDPASITSAIIAIIDTRLLKALNVERNYATVNSALRHKMAEEQLHKKVFTEALLQYAYFKGMFTRLPRVQINNLSAEYSAEIPKDQSIIEFIYDGAVVLCKVHTAILVSSSAAVAEAKFEDEPVYSECGFEFSVNDKGRIAVKVKYADSYSKNPATMELLMAKWNQKLKEIADYMHRYIVVQQHDEKRLNALLHKYPEIQSHEDTNTCSSFFYQKPTVEDKGRDLFAYLGRHDADFITEHREKLNYYAAKGEEQYVYALKVLCAMSRPDLVLTAIQPYLAMRKDNLSEAQYTEENYLRRAYQFMRGQAVYVILDLQPSMKFVDATVLTQDPAQMLQFDDKGKMRVLVKGEALVGALPLCNDSLLETYRYKGVVDYVKPYLNVAQIKELHRVIAANKGVNLLRDHDYFTYPSLENEVNENIVQLADMPDSYYQYLMRLTFL